MMNNTDTIAEELNRLYEFEMDKYINECNIFKGAGFRIFRNSEGKHKVVAPQKAEPLKNDDIYKVFGGVFGDIFGGK